MPNRRLILSVLAALACAGVRGVHAEPKAGDALIHLTYNVSPDPRWEPGLSVLLYADGRRNPAINKEDIFKSQQFPGVYPRAAGQRFDLTLPGVRVGEKIIVQGYMCAAGTTDCYPSDRDNPPSCSIEVHILGSLLPSCRPVFTWTGGQAGGGVQCRAECVKEPQKDRT